MSKDAPHLKVGRWLAIALLVSGLASVPLTLVPAQFGVVDWEFGKLGELAATFALPMMGLVAALVISLYDRRRWAVGVLGVTMILMALVLLGLVAILITDAPIVLAGASVLQPSESTSVKVVLIKSLGLFLIFSVGLFGTGIGALRSVQRGR